MPFSQIFPPSPSLTESIRLFYTSVSLLLLRAFSNATSSRKHSQTPKTEEFSLFSDLIVLYWCLLYGTKSPYPVSQLFIFMCYGQEYPPEKGMACPLQYPCLENPIDRGAYSPKGRKESDTTERLTLSLSLCP